MGGDVALTGVERMLPDGEFIVSKTDLNGRITYANDVFLRVAGYEERELIGAPHNIVRHPAMPPCAFKLVWDTIAQGKDILAYVINKAKNGDHYWVLAHVTPTVDLNGNIGGYHSTRRRPSRLGVETMTAVYAKLCAEEKRHSSRKAGMEAATAMLLADLKAMGVSYNGLIYRLQDGDGRAAA